MYYLLHSDSAPPERVGSIEIQKRINGGTLTPDLLVSIEASPDDIHPARHFFNPQFEALRQLRARSTQRPIPQAAPTPVDRFDEFLKALNVVCYPLIVAVVVVFAARTFLSLGTGFSIAVFAILFALAFSLLAPKTTGGQALVGCAGISFGCLFFAAAGALLVLGVFLEVLASK